MSLYVVVFCVLLLVLLSVMHQWKLLLLLGLLFIGCVAALLWYNRLEHKQDKASIQEIETVHIFHGSEKKELLKDLRFQELLRKNHGLVIKGIKQDGIDFSAIELQDMDGLWLSNVLALKAFKDQYPHISHTVKEIFYTRLVFYSWSPVVKLLIHQGIVEKEDTLYKISNIKKLLEMGEQTWESFRLSHLKGQVCVRFPDPGQTTTGLLTLNLIVASLNNGKTINDIAEIEKYQADIQKINQLMGEMESSSDVLFYRYIKQGMSLFPLITGCENQVIEFYRAFPRYQDKIKDQVRVLTLDPGLSSEHFFIALTPKGEQLLKALEDPELQKLAWEKFGFRSGVEGIDNNPGGLKLIGIPKNIKKEVMPLPDLAIVKKMVEFSYTK